MCDYNKKSGQRHRSSMEESKLILANQFCFVVVRGMEEEMALHSSILVWRTPWSEESGGLQSRGHRVGHNLATKQQHAS